MNGLLAYIAVFGNYYLLLVLLTDVSHTHAYFQKVPDDVHLTVNRRSCDKTGWAVVKTWLSPPASSTGRSQREQCMFVTRRLVHTHRHIDKLHLVELRKHEE